MDEAQRAIVAVRVDKFREDQEYSDDYERSDEARTGQILSDAERFIVRLERHSREGGALE